MPKHGNLFGVTAIGFRAFGFLGFVITNNFKQN